MIRPAPRLVCFSSEQFVLPLPAGHRFPMHKYRLLRERAERLAGIEIRIPPALVDADLRRVHTEGYIRDFVSGQISTEMQRAIGFPWSEAMVERSRRSAGATVAAARAAMAEGGRIAVNLAGGTHHAFADRGEGFCCFNDAALAIRILQAEGLVRRAAVIDCDVHQGNGTAAIFAADPSVFTVSLHGEENYPFQKMTSSLDIGLPTGCDDATYLHALGRALRAVDAWGPADLVVYLAGADVLGSDRLGKLALTPEGVAARDAAVFDWALTRGLPVAVAMAGGYSEPIEATVAAQARTLELALERLALDLCV